MQPTTLRWAYMLLALIEIGTEWSAAQTGNLIGVWMTKPLMMPLLFGLCIIHFRNLLQRPNWANWLLIALIGCWLGDIFLMLKGFQPELFFLLGLGLFLLAHGAYMVCFQKQIKSMATSQLKEQPGILILLLGYGLGMIAYLFQHGGADFQAMQFPVLAYTLVIMSMLAVAYNRFRQVSSRSFRWVMAGAVLFAVSDSIIALSTFTNLFKTNESLARILIMTLYLGGQYYIVEGVLASKSD